MNSKKLHPFTRDCIKDLNFPYSLHERQKLEKSGYIDLASNINPFGHEYSKYPDLDHAELKQKYASILSKQSVTANRGPLEITPSQILFTRGIVEAIDLLIRAFCDPGKDKIFIPTPTFQLYEYWAKASNIEVFQSKLLGDNFDSVSIDELKKVKPKLTFLCNPNNPVGSVLSESHVQEVLNATDGLVVIDEAYIDFCPEHSSLSLLRDNPNLVILRSFSKAWGLAGIRAASVLADESILNALQLVQGPFAIAQPVLDLLGKRLGEWPKVQEEEIEKTVRERERVAKELRKLSLFGQVFEGNSNFLFARASHSKLLTETLLNRSLMVENFETEALKGIRVSIGTRKQNDLLLKSFSLNKENLLTTLVRLNSSPDTPFDLRKQT